MSTHESRIPVNAVRTTCESGSALVVAVVLAAVVMGMIVASTLSTLASTRIARTHATKMRTDHLAESAFGLIGDVIIDASQRGQPPPTEGVVNVAGHSVYYRVALGSGPHSLTDAAGLATESTIYRTDSTARSGQVASTRGAWLAVNATPLFQHAVFYENDLAITPTPPMTVTGRIHTNSDLYLASWGNDIHLNSNHVQVVGRVHRRFQPGGTISSANDVWVRRWIDDVFDTGKPAAYVALENVTSLTALGVPSVAGYDSEFQGFDANGDGDFGDAGDWPPFLIGSLDRYADPLGSGQTTLRVGGNGATQGTPPTPETTDPFVPDPSGDYEWDAASHRFVASVAPGTGTHARGSYNGDAGLRVLVHGDASGFVAEHSGADVTASLSTAISVDAIYDYRQGGYSPVVRIDVGALNASGQFPANGLLFVAHHTMGNGTLAKGVELHNASQLAGPLTVVTDGPAYLNGDYNTISPVPAAVICDAINLLSNSWVNDHTIYTIATDTTYNVAIATGDTPLTSSTYNGGLENLPRFHEDWLTGSAVCRVFGSICVLWYSRYADAPFTYTRRAPPVRDYRYNPDFDDPTNLPPFTPRIIRAETLASW